MNTIYAKRSRNQTSAVNGAVHRYLIGTRAFEETMDLLSASGGYGNFNAAEILLQRSLSQKNKLLLEKARTQYHASLSQMPKLPFTDKPFSTYVMASLRLSELKVYERLISGDSLSGRTEQAGNLKSLVICCRGLVNKLRSNESIKPADRSLSLRYLGSSAIVALNRRQGLEDMNGGMWDARLALVNEMNGGSLSKNKLHDPFDVAVYSQASVADPLDLSYKVKYNAPGMDADVSSVSIDDIAMNDVKDEAEQLEGIFYNCLSSNNASLKASIANMLEKMD